MASDIRLGGAYISFRAEDANFNKSVRRTGSGLRRLGAQVDRTARRMRNFNSVAGSLTRTFLPLFGAFGLAEAARRFVELSDTMLLASARLALVSENAEEAANAQERLFKIAQQTRQDFSTLVTIYGRFGRATRQLGIESDLLLQFVENISKAVIISGASVKEANAGLIQLSQALAIGSLRGDELRSVMEQLPRVMLAVADGLGTSLGALRKLSQAGLLSTVKVIEGLLNQTEELQEEFARVPVTVAGALRRIRNSILQTVDTLSRSEGVADDLVAALNRLQQVLSNPAVISGFTEIVAGIVDSITLLVANIDRAAQVAFLLIGTIALLRSGFLRTGQAARIFTAGITGMAAAARGFVASFTLFNRALRLGPSGVFLPFLLRTRDLLGRVRVSLAAATAQARGFAAALALATSLGVSGFFFSLRTALVGTTSVFQAAAVAARLFAVQGLSLLARVAQTTLLASLRAVVQVLRVSLVTALAAARTAMVGLLTATRALVVGLGRLVFVVGRVAASFAAFLAIFELVGIIIKLNRAAKDLGATFTDVILVLGVGLVVAARKAATALIGFLGQAFSSLGRIIRDSITGDTGFITERLLSGIANVTDSVGRALQEGADSLRQNNTFQDDLVNALGLEPEQANTLLGLLSRFTSEAGDNIAGLFTPLNQAIPQTNANLEEVRENINNIGDTVTLARGRQLTAELRDDLTDNFLRIQRQLEQRANRIGLDEPDRVAADFTAKQREATASFLEERTRAIRDLNDDILGIEQAVAAPRAQGGSDVALRIAALEAEKTRSLSALNIGMEELALVKESLETIKQRTTARAEELRAQAEELVQEERLAAAFQRSADAVAQFTTSVLSDFRTIEQAAINLARSVLTEFLKLLVTRPFVNAVGGSVAGFFGIPFSAAQHGGFHRGATLVGERGPELVDFEHQGRVYSNQDLAAAFGGGGGGRGINLTVVNNIQSTDGPGVRAALEEALPAMTATVQSGIMAAVGRPSPIREAVAG